MTVSSIFELFDISKSILHTPFTYLVRTGNEMLYDLYIFVPTPAGFGLKDPEIIPASDPDPEARVQNMIHFINFELVKSDTAKHFTRIPILRKTTDQDESIEVRVRDPYMQTEFIWFNKSVIFFEDADEVDSENRPESWTPDQDLAIHAPYTFIGKPKDFFDPKREGDPTFVVHVLIPLPGDGLLIETVEATKGENSWQINTNENGSISILEREENVLNQPAMPQSRGIGQPVAKATNGIKRLRVNIRNSTIDKPTAPDRGSGGNSTNIFLRM